MTSAADYSLAASMGKTMKRKTGVVAGGAPATDTLITAVAGKKIRILALALHATATTVNSVYLVNGDNGLLFNSGNPLKLSLTTAGDDVASFILPWNPGGWCDTDTVNEAVALTSSAAQDIAYAVTYIEFD